MLFAHPPHPDEMPQSGRVRLILQYPPVLVKPFPALSRVTSSRKTSSPLRNIFSGSSSRLPRGFPSKLRDQILPGDQAGHRDLLAEEVVSDRIQMHAVTGEFLLNILPASLQITEPPDVRWPGRSPSFASQSSCVCSPAPPSPPHAEAAAYPRRFPAA